MVNLGVGIDLGTTNSCVSICDSDYRTTLINVENSRDGIFPSCVRYRSRNEVEVGKSAYDHKDLPSVVYSMKRHMEEGNSYKHTVIADNGEEFEVTPIEVASHVLKALIDGAEEYMGVKGSVKKVTITVPAYFTEIARKHTVEAGVMAGLNEEDITLINEPTAAAVSYGIDVKSDYEKVIVYDLGGGTFDSAVLEITKDGKIPNYNVVKSDGDSQLGGDDIDKELLNIFYRKLAIKINTFLRDNGVTGVDVKEKDILMSLQEKEGLLLSLEKCKKSNAMSGILFSVKEENLTEDAKILVSNSKIELPIVVTVPISETDIENATKDVVGYKTLDITSRLIEESSYTSSTEIGRILLIGGSTKSEHIVKMLREEFEEVPVKSYTDPDESVALGASIYSMMIAEGKGDKLQDCIQIPIGIKLAKESNPTESYVKTVIEQNTKLPAHSKLIRLETSYDNQDFINLEIYQGNKYLPVENVRLGTLEIRDIPVRKRGEVTYLAKFIVDVNGILTMELTQICEGEEKKTYKQQVTRLSSSSGKDESKTSGDRIKRRRIEKLKSLSSTSEEFEKNLEIFNGLESQSDIKNFFDSLESKYKSSTNMFE